MKAPRLITGVLESIGGVTLGVFHFLGGIGLICREVFGHTIRGFFKGRSVSWRSFTHQAVRVGPRSLGVVCCVNLFIGMILALIGGEILIPLGVVEFVGDLMGIGIVLELGPLITGIIMAGYIGAALAAEIATMVVSEEITAMRTMSLNPMRFVVAPRLLAVFLMVPCVTIIGDAVGILGGLVIAESILDMGQVVYFEHVWDALDHEEIQRGLIKATVFGVIIGSVGCYQGFKVKGGAEGVGLVTTNAVVQSIIAIIISDAILNYFLLFRA